MKQIQSWATHRRRINHWNVASPVERSEISKMWSVFLILILTCFFFLSTFSRAFQRTSSRILRLSPQVFDEIFDTFSRCNSIHSLFLHLFHHYRNQPHFVAAKSRQREWTDFGSHFVTRSVAAKSTFRKHRSRICGRQMKLQSGQRPASFQSSIWDASKCSSRAACKSARKL